MIHTSCKVVPESAYETDESLIRDCDVATTLLAKIMNEDSTLTPTAAYTKLQRRIAPVCVFHWDRMKLQR